METGYTYLPSQGSSKSLKEDSADQAASWPVWSFGVAKTESLLATLYTWKGMREQIAQIISTCVPCQPSRARFQLDPQLHPIEVEAKAWETIGIDFAGPFP